MANRNFVISGSEDINIYPVQIDISLVGQANTEYEDLKAIIVIAQSRQGLTKEKMNQANEKLDNIIQIAKKAIIGYKAKKTEKRKEELKDILTMVKKAKSAIKVIELKYMLENDSPESEERRRLMTGWTREQADADEKARRIKDIDVPVIDANDFLSGDR